MNSKDVTIILPVHDVKGNFVEWFDKAVKSVERSVVKPQKLRIIIKETEERKKN